MILVAVLPSSIPLDAQSQLSHPNRENLATPPGTRAVARTDSVSRNARLLEWAVRLRAAEISSTAGALDGDADYAFGTLSDVSVSTRYVALLDRSQLRVILLDHSLQLQGAVGREGSGPSEFRQPLAIALEADTVLRVFDSVLGMKRFRLTGAPVTASLVRAVPPTVAVQSICLNGPKTIGVAPSSMQRADGLSGDVEPLLSVFAPNGEVVRSFGESYRSPNPLVRRIMSEATLGCGRSGEVLVALSQLPLLRVYAPSGELTRWVRFTDFQIAYSIERPNSRGQPSIGIDPSTQRMHSFAKITEVAPRLFAVQVAGYAMARDRRSIPQVSLATYLVDAVEGDAVYVSSSLPFLGHVGPDYAIGFRNDPYPQVLRLTFRKAADERGGRTR